MLHFPKTFASTYVNLYFNIFSCKSHIILSVYSIYIYDMKEYVCSLVVPARVNIIFMLGMLRIQIITCF